MENYRRTFSIFLLLFATIFLFAALHTDRWFEKAVPKRNLKDSYIYKWQDLDTVCTQFPQDSPPVCVSLGKTGLSLACVKGLLYASLVISCVAIGVVFVMIIIMKRMVMDILTIFAALSGFFSMIAMSIYTHNHVTHVKIFDMFGYSYVCGWLSCICSIIGGLVSFLTRFNEEDILRIEMDR